MTPFSLYVHIPFCAHRCAYCDFNTYAGQEALIPAYVDALCAEIRVVATAAGERLPAHTVFFGGGTPSLLTPAQIDAILSALRESFDVAQDAEISLEANPGTLTLAQLRELRALGMDRLSLGVQSADPGELRLLERIHDMQDVADAVAWARTVGFEDLSLDLIYGLPGQALATWRSTLEQALALAPEHLSLYALTIEHGTPFGRMAQRGELALPDPDLAAEMLDLADRRLAQAGYRRYEISNWARDVRLNGAQRGRSPGDPAMVPAFACRHNLTYWRNRPYLGFGAGAHGCASGMRVSNVLRIQTYIDRLSQINDLHYSFPISPATVNHTRLTPRVEMQETMMLGLRLTEEGVRADEFQARFSMSIDDAFPKEIADLTRLGLLEWADPHLQKGDGTGGRLRLTPRGRQVGNQVFLRFVGE